MAKLSVVINARNVEADLPHAVFSVKKIADEIIVIDQNSSDSTAGVAKKLGATVFTYEDVRYVELARNFAVSKATGEWILVLDPDEEIPESLGKKIKDVVSDDKADYFRIPRKNLIFGKWIKNSRWWPDYNIRLFKKGSVSWSEIIHSVPMTKGKGLELPDKEEFAIIHHHYDSIEKYLEHLNRYTSVQADLKVKDGYKFLWRDLIDKPVSEFLSRYFMGEGYKDGIHGLALSLLQSFSELILYLKIWQKEKFKEVNPKVSEIISAVSTKEKELHFWQNDALYKETKNISYRIRKKFGF